MSKDQWVKDHEELEEELGREPTTEEVDERVIDFISDAYDRAKDIRKYGE